MMTEWKILSKVVGSRTDNAKNIANAMQTLGIINMGTHFSYQYLSLSN